MVKAGYKQSEIGEIPEDWSLQPLGQHFEFKNGLNKAKEFFGHGTPIINYMDVFSNPGVASSDIVGKVTVNKDEINSYSARRGDVFFTRTSENIEEIGLSTVLVEDLKDAVFSGFVLRAREKGVEFYIDFKKYVFRSELVRKQIKATSSYTTRALTNGKLLSQVLLPYPKDPDEQKAIADALSDADALIASLEKLIEKKRDIKTATMQQLLTGKKRLPGFGDGKGTKLSELGEIPEDWDAARIGDTFDFKNGLNKAKAYFGYGTPIINYMDVFSNSGIDAARIQGLVQVSRDEINNYSAKKGDVFFTRTSETVDEIGVSSVLVDGVPNAVFSGFVLRARERDEKHSLSLEFKKYCFGSDVVRKQVRSTSSYTTRALTNGKLLSEVRFPRPRDIREQGEIAKVISHMETEISSIGKLLQKTKAIKQGMMQELLTGRTRLV